MKPERVWALALALAASWGLAAGGAEAQSRIEERRTADKDAVVNIDNAAGSIKVVGWDKPELLVTGSLGARAEGLSVTGTSRRIAVEVETQGNPNRVESDLEIRVPAGCRLEIQSFSAAITVSEVAGRVRAESVSGSIAVSGKPTEVELETVSGSIDVAGSATRVKASAVNGSVVVKGASGLVEASTVNGRLEVRGGAFDEARLETVNGSLLFEGGLSRTASLDAETVNGSIDLLLPADQGADFSISSFGGEVDSDFGLQLKPTAEEPGRRKHKHDDGEKEMSFSTGGGGAMVTINTLNGRVALRKK